MEVQHTTADDGGRLFIEGADGNEAGFLEYTLADNQLTVEHTVVTDELKGTGAARKLVDELVRFGQAKNYRFASNCEYATHIFDKYYDL